MSVITDRALAAGISNAEPLFIINPHNMGFYDCIGSHAQLLEEGLIPPSIQLPESGFDTVEWADSRLEYAVWRIRPPGASGPRRDFATVDLWCLRVYPQGGYNPFADRVRHLRKELAHSEFVASPAGIHRINSTIQSLAAARADKGFSRFKESLGLPAGNRGRRAKPATFTLQPGSK